MRSFDLFNTLTASRTGLNAGEVGMEDHIPIVENVVRVRRGDIVISDYHTRAKAELILRSVCGLSNRLIVTDDGKASGLVWRTIRPQQHVGDNPHCDFNTPREHGIPADITSLW